MRATITSLLLCSLSIANLSIAFPVNSEPTPNLISRQVDNNGDLAEGQQCAGDEDGSSFNAYACVWVERDRNSYERIRVRYAVLNPSNNDPVYARYSVYWRDRRVHESARLIEKDERGARKKGWRKYDRDGIDVDKVRISACIEKGDPDRDDDDKCEHQEIYLTDFRERNF